jgi:hypothetical protein
MPELTFVTEKQGPNFFLSLCVVGNTVQKPCLLMSYLFFFKPASVEPSSVPVEDGLRSATDML